MKDIQLKKQRQSNKILIIAPHQDDEIIGCGGTMLKLIKSGQEILVQHVYLGNTGVAGLSGTASAKLRHLEALNSARVAGYKILPNLGIEDRKNTNESNIIYLLVSIIRKYNPNIIFAPHDQEQDFEHQIVAKAAWEASWMAGAFIYPEISKPREYTPQVFLGYEVWRPIANISLFVDITSYIKKKRLLLKKFKSQVRISNLMNGSLGLNAYRGNMLQGKGYAEAFTFRSLDSKVSDTILNIMEEK